MIAGLLQLMAEAAGELFEKVSIICHFLFAVYHLLLQISYFLCAILYLSFYIYHLPPAAYQLWFTVSYAL